MSNPSRQTYGFAPKKRCIVLLVVCIRMVKDGRASCEIGPACKSQHKGDRERKI